MRKLTASAIVIAALSLGASNAVLAQGAPAQPEAQAKSPASKSPDSKSEVTIRSIQVVDIKDLQPEVRAKLDDLVANTNEKDLQSLRQSIDATPQATSVLKARGYSSSQVVAINIVDGVLTMFAKTA